MIGAIALGWAAPVLSFSLSLPFFRDRAWSRFSLRREEKFYTRVGFRTKTDSAQSNKHDYIIPVARPESLSSLQTADSRHLKPA